MFGFGEMTAFAAADGYRTIIFGASHNGTTGAYNQWSSHGIMEDCSSPGISTAVLAQQAPIHVAKTYDGLIDSPAAILSSMGFTPNNSIIGTNPASAPVFLHCPFHVMDYDGNANGANRNVVRGVIPYLSLGNLHAGGGTSPGDIIQVNGSEFLVVISGTSTSISSSNAAPAYLRKTDDEPGRV
jgi:hypothetical protein